VVYLTLFCLTTQISGSLIPNPWFTYRGLGRLWPMRAITYWVARTMFGVDVPLDDVSGGETLFFWIQWSWILATAVVITAIWTLRASRRSYASWLPWGLLAARLMLAASMLEYGMTKVIPTQFPAPPLTALVTPVGDLTLSALLWTTIGSAPAYQIATGCVEVLAGVLLLLPRTVTLGALLALASLTQVLLLNLTFDIGVKLVSMHLIALAGILLAPVARSLAGVLVRLKADPATEVGLPPSRDALRRTGKTDTTWTILPIVLGVYLLGMQTWINWSFWQVGGGGRPKSVLYGIWNVERLSVDGQVRPPESNDYDRRWRRVIFDDPEAVVFQRTDHSFANYGATFDRSNGAFVLTKGGSLTWTSGFTYDRASNDQLMLAGDMDGHKIEAQLRLVDPSAFPLLNSSFRWIRPHDP
jgi:hypothetical protein